MRILGRAILFVVGVFLAIPAGLLAFAIGVAFEPAAQDLIAALGAAGFETIVSVLSGELAVEGLFVGLWTLLATLFVLPPSLIAVIGEVIGIRTFVWYGLGCGALTGALPWLRRGTERSIENGGLEAEGRITALLFATGAVAGLTYWLVAGRSAGGSTAAARRPKAETNISVRT